MRLSWNEIRARAAAFAKDWRGQGYERGDTQTFYNEFFEVFGQSRKRVAVYEQAVKKSSSGNTGFIDLYWKGVLLVEQKGAGLDLKKAKQQAFDYLPGIKDGKDLPRFILLCDFQSFELHDLETRKEWKFGLQQLPEKVQAFSFMFGGVQREFKDEDPVNIKASELMGELHDALKASGYGGHDLERFLVRLVFCLFADDTGIFTPRGILTEYIENRTTQDGADLGPKLGKLFEVLNQPEDKRQKTLDEDLAQFPYVNGDLFGDRLPLPDFDGPMRKLLLEACAFDWSKISPAIFGSLFQSVMDKKKRRAIGAHYTNEQNIMKVIGPLFLDGLKAELKHLKGRHDTSRDKALLAFQDKMAGLKFLDPACGCGNFLVIAYRELRALETEIILDQKSNLDLFADKLSKVNVDQFYGIEFEEFPVRIAETALWMMDHIMNQRLSDDLGEVKLRIPLQAKPTIRHGDALEINWADVLPPEKCSYVFGNPPFVGKHLLSDEQSASMERVFGRVASVGNLDFVAAWFMLAARYIKDTKISCAFVATNSLSQGEQVPLIWNAMFGAGVFINFAHRTFAWGSEARGKAHVHCVIIGFSGTNVVPKRLFEYSDIDGEPTEVSVGRLSPYLIDAPNTLIATESNPIVHWVRPAAYGSKPVDDGNLLFTESEMTEFVAITPEANKFFKPIVSNVEFLYGEQRWCLWLADVDPSAWRHLNTVVERVEKVRAFRENSKKEPTRRAAKRSFQFAEIRQPKQDFIVIPQHTSEKREYVPFGFFDASYVVHNSCTCVPDGGFEMFGLLTSSMHMAWLRFIGGRIKSDYRYSSGLVYNPFPWPELDDAKKEKVGKLGQAILDARLKHPQSTLADLYDPLTMPADLRKAHEANDKAVDQLYRREVFASDRERVEFLLARSE
jgi:N-6 DNA Methylase